MRRPSAQLRMLLAVSAASALVNCGRPVVHRRPVQPAPAPPAHIAPFTATAYSGGLRTASGTRPHAGIVAADPAVLPLGSRIHVRGAGAYSGQYVVRDTGGKVRGRTIDIYMGRRAQAKRFGRRTVTVEVIKYGDRGPAASLHRNRGHRHRRPHRRHNEPKPPGPPAEVCLIGDGCAPRLPGPSAQRAS
jgi:3D (Asp-Asp-Asp) domain-containing protein